MIQRLLVVLFSIILLVRADSESKYFLGDQGQSCSQVCVNQGMNCNAHIVTDDSPQKFFDLGVNCTLDTRKWWAHDQPAYVTEQGDPNYGKCLGFYGVPGGVLCHQAYHASRRLCRCDMPSKDFMEFGTGVAHIVLTPEEQMIYAHTVAAGDVGVMTHFWITYKTGTDEGVIIRYYVDDEVVPSLKFTPSLAAGVGFYDKQAPWGTDLIGKGAVDGSWYINIRVPFQKNIRITAQHLKGTYDDVYILVRGGTNIPIQIGDVPIPKNAKLQLFTIDQTLHPYAWATLADVPHGSDGLFFFVTMSARSSGPAFLEGCLHLYTSARSEFPGLILGTGTEDYFDSGWFFNGGQFHLPNAGFTHLLDKKGNFEFSAYRFHIQDPIRFSNGMRFVWRNGDILDAAKVKCMVPGTDGSPANPDTTDTALQSYSWVYVWSPQEAGITMEVQ